MFHFRHYYFDRSMVTEFIILLSKFGIDFLEDGILVGTLYIALFNEDLFLWKLVTYSTRKKKRSLLEKLATLLLRTLCFRKKKDVL